MRKLKEKLEKIYQDLFNKGLSITSIPMLDLRSFIDHFSEEDSVILEVKEDKTSEYMKAIAEDVREIKKDVHDIYMEL